LEHFEAENFDSGHLSVVAGTILLNDSITVIFIKDLDADDESIWYYLNFPFFNSKLVYVSLSEKEDNIINFAADSCVRDIFLHC